MDDGVKLRLQVEGHKAAPAVLFSHSVGCDLTLWNDQFDALKAQFRVIRYDARGHGGSDVPEGDYISHQRGPARASGRITKRQHGFSANSSIVTQSAENRVRVR